MAFSSNLNSQQRTMQDVKTYSDISDSSDTEESWVRLKKNNGAQPQVSRESRIPHTPTHRQNSTPLIASSSGTLKRHNTHPMTQSTQRVVDSKSSHFSATPTLDTRKHRVIVISSDEEDDTDLEPSPVEDPPSSQSSISTPFTSVSATSSLTSIEPSGSQRQILAPKISKFDKEEKPSVVQDVFHSVATKRKISIPIHKPRPHQQSPVTQSQSQDTIDQRVLEFANSPFGTDLELEIIAHSHDMQETMDYNQLAWGVQYELARGVSAGLWTWEAAKDQIHKLRGTNEEAAFKVERIMKSRDASGPSDHRVWRQLDLEQAAILENKGRGLGLMGEFQGAADWYGGKVQQIARLIKSDGIFKVKLDRLESRRSNRFARYYGSRRFLQIRVPEDSLQNEREKVKKFFRRKFILCGRVFVPFHAKEKNVYLVETDEDYDRQSRTWCGDQFRHTFNAFINWHNPLDVAKNTKQVISKYTARFALGLSNSKPAVEFDEENIYFIDDITADGWPKDKKAPADKLMTDGCGFLNHAALRVITQNNGYDSIPAGVQGRIDGSKGFFIIHPTDLSAIPKVWIRDSQNKIKNRSFDRAHRIFDLLCASQSSPPASITQQSIINIFANGIPAQLLVRLMEQGLEEDVAPLLEWDRDDATLLLYDTISKCGGVPLARAQRVAYSLNRVLGFTGRDWHDDDWMPENEEEEEETNTGRNKFSGIPLGLHEVIIELLQSGFHPKENILLQEKIKIVMESVIKTSVEKYRIPIPESIGAFIVPDPLGVLKEGEVCYRFSKPRKDQQTDMLCYALEGPILVGRYPIRLPSDIQRVTAVQKRELDRWPDVLIVSIKGKRSIASLLADGDMDGDEIIAIYNKELVSLFKNQPFTEAPPMLIEKNFNRNVEYADRFCSRVCALSSREAHEEFQDVLIANLSESCVGLYSMMHEKACIRYGYSSPEAIRLAYVFATLLDSSKNGCRLQDGLLKKDLNKYGSTSRYAPVSTTMDDILGTLKSAGKRKGEELLMKYKDLGPLEEWEADDDALLRPFQVVGETADKYYRRGFGDYRKELNAIVGHVDEAYSIYGKTWRKYFDKKEQETPVKEKGKSRKAKTEDLMMECSRKFAEPIAGIELIGNVEEVKASYAYHKKPKFAFRVAFRELCLLKVKSRPEGFIPVLQKFDEAKKVNGLYMRALRQADKE